jgi:hypothetical protein
MNEEKTKVLLFALGHFSQENGGICKRYYFIKFMSVKPFIFVYLTTLFLSG